VIANAIESLLDGSFGHSTWRLNTSLQPVNC
jgi:hypothetical protein